MPKSWSISKARPRRRQAKVPKGLKLVSKIQLTKQMLKSTFKAGIDPAWFVADEVYSRNSSFWRWLEPSAQQPYVLTVSKQQSTMINFPTHRADELLKQLQPDDWQRLSCGKGTKGERESEWARFELSCTRPEEFKRWFLFRRHPHPSIQRPSVTIKCLLQPRPLG